MSEENVNGINAGPQSANNVDAGSKFLLDAFNADHLREDLRLIAAEFEKLARWATEHLPNNFFRVMVYRQLLEAKDSAIRAVVSGVEEPTDGKWVYIKTQVWGEDRGEAAFALATPAEAPK